ncbi:MAG: ATP-dependent DNA helicase [Polyangiaceae bacterium]|nr:ATP-dependent DNA helicase [Polyangiaceae bacterium]
MTSLPNSQAQALLGADGPIARALSRYESREGQIQMADAVFRALDEERVLLCEAGTGTGKTLAYLLPALLSGKKLMVSTATRALQEQIFKKDLPLIARALGKEPEVALMKGLSNYVCKRRYRQFLASEAASQPHLGKRLRVLNTFVENTTSGDLAEAEGLAEDDDLWSQVTSSSDTRVGPTCQFYDECFVTRMKRDAERARLVVVNHHLFFADLALRGPHPGRVLPDYDAVIFDEAHQLEDIATNFFGSSVSSSGVERLVRDFEQIPALSGPLFSGADILRVADQARNAANAFWSMLRTLLPANESRVTLERDVWSKELIRLWHGVDATLEALGLGATSLGSKLTEGTTRGAVREALDVVARRAQTIRQDLAIVVEGGRGRVTWLDVSERSLRLVSTPVEVRSTFRERVFDAIGSVVLTSATLSTSESRGPVADAFSYIRARLGIDEDLAVEELRVASPFNYDKAALLYVARGLPEPNHPGFVNAAAAQAEELVRITEGGCFVLCTSVKSMRLIHGILKAKLQGYPVLLQGTASKTLLLEQFRASENAVLVATMSFWQGVDVPGRALRLVIIEKLPFPVPSEPVLRARSTVLEEQGKNPFMELFVPQAAITLKQGFGRLIRTQDDRGIVVLLDERAVTRSYGKKLLGALPPARRAENLAEVADFWRRVDKV